MPSNKSPIVADWLRFAAIGQMVLVGLYLSIRAFLVPIFSDEAFSFFTFIQTGDFIPFKAYLNANNHVLNSAFAYVSYCLFGKGIFWLRLPNLIGFLLFCFGLLKIGNLFKSKWVWVSMITTILLTHYLVDFFMVCRGYGLSFGFLMMSLAYAMEFTANKKQNRALISLLLASLAIWSNLALLVTTLSIGVMLVMFWLYQNRHTSLGDPTVMKFLSGFLFLFIIPHSVAIIYALELQNSGLLYVGSSRGFYQSTIESLINEISRSKVWYAYSVKILILIYLVTSLISVNRLKSSKQFLLVQSTLWLNVLGIVILYHLADVYYPVERAAAHLLVLFFLALYLTLDTVVRNWLSAVGFIFSVATAVVFFLSANTTHTLHWKTEAIPNEVREILFNWKSKHGRPPTLSAHGLQKTVLNFQDYLDSKHMPNQMEGLRQSQKVDFILTDHWSPLYPTMYDTVLFHSNTELALLKRNTHIHWDNIHTDSLKAAQIVQEFHGLADYQFEPYSTPRAALVTVSIQVSSDVNPIKWWIVSKVTDGVGNIVFQTSTDMQPSGGEAIESSRIELSQVLDPIPTEGKSLTVFIWNMDKEKMNLVGGSISIAVNSD